MTAVKVCREGSSVHTCLENDPLLNWGEDIQDVLITEDAVAIEKGRVTIDENHKNKLIVSGQLPFLDTITPTDIIEINTKKGRLLSLDLSITENSRRTTLRVETLND